MTSGNGCQTAKFASRIKKVFFNRQEVSMKSSQNSCRLTEADTFHTLD